MVFIMILQVITDPLELVAPAGVVKVVVVVGMVIVVVITFVVNSSVDEEDEEVADDSINDEEGGNEGQAKTTPADPEDHPKSAIEHVDDDELSVGDDPNINVNPPPSLELLDEL